MISENINIDGKVLLFTDLHLGLANNKESRMKIAVLAIREIVKFAKENGIRNIIFLGDWNHSRVNTENQILNVSYKLMSLLQKQCNIYCIVGNHDIYLKNSVDINSLVIFKDLDNVKIVESTTLLTINGRQCLMVPWLGDMSTFQKESIDMLFGHFDISSKFLIKQYVQQNKMKQGLSSSESNAGDLVGDFVDIAKKDGVIFSGHIHQRKEFISKGRRFVFVGSPYQQNLGDLGCKCGFYVLDEKCEYHFNEISSTPKHVELRMSDILSDVDGFDFSIVKGNIVHKIYDVEVSVDIDTKISQKISDYRPYDEILPEYDIKTKFLGDEDSEIAQKTVELLKKSKLAYIQNYVDNMDDEALKEDKIEKKPLFKLLEKYYDACL